MPELPEIETISRALSQGGNNWPSILGKTITEVNILWERTLETPSAEEFKARIIGQGIKEVDRRGKFLHIHLTSDSLIIHLRMSGDILIEPEDEEIATHHRLLLIFDDGWRMAFNDTRKFGRVWLVDDPVEVFKRLGPEPLASEFTSDVLYQRLVSHRRQLKPLLMDQCFLAGMGNIYTDEALHLAKLNPLTRSDTISEGQAEELWRAIRHVLLEGIHNNGASIDWVYRGGDFQNYFRVYQRTGEPCPDCDTPIIRIVVGQRGTHLCPTCQPDPDS